MRVEPTCRKGAPNFSVISLTGGLTPPLQRRNFILVLPHILWRIWHGTTISGAKGQDLG